jgi:DNA repair exonuclease SbcCD ATPase subunit
MWTKINFEVSSSVLIQGNNGSGKSASILDSLTFVLYGKPFRKINKTALVNNKNKKEMVVEVWFTDEKGEEYHIIRGLNPGIFEIRQGKDEILVNQDSNVRDYQVYLEKQILKMDFQMFTQIVVLGKATYVAFLRLAQNERRKFIENLLNLSIFSVMNEVTKAKMSEIKNRLMVIKNSLQLLKNQIDMSENHINDLEQESIRRQIEHEKMIEEQIQEIQNEIDLIQVDIESKKKGLLEIDADLDSLNKRLETCYDLQSKIDSKLSDTHKKIRFFANNTICPTCDNEIDSNIRQNKISQFNQKEQELVSAQDQLSFKTSAILSDITAIQKRMESNRRLEQQIILFEQTIQQRLSDIARIEKNKMIRVLSNDDMIKEYKREHAGLIASREAQNDERTASNAKQDCYEFILAMLKDNGIKTSIIKRHIPNIVATTNHYLKTLGLFVRFELNENFEESLLGRGIDQITYNAYSEGEKLRIDLAMLLTWRDILRKQNNLSVNFIIFDEILDSSADANGIENLLDIFKSMKSDGTKIFVISHSSHWTENFDEIWTIEKTGGFSTIKT